MIRVSGQTTLLLMHFQCDRQYPCNRCIRRRRPEECVYRTPPREVSSHQGPVNAVHNQPGTEIWSVRETLAADSPSHWSSQHSALVTSFGYFEESNSNTIALLRGVFSQHEQSQVAILTLLAPLVGFIWHRNRPIRSVASYLGHHSA
jgi:hypothetical protein